MLDVLIILAFVVYSVGSGFLYRKKASQGLDEYFLAGRSLKGGRAGISMAATQYAADTPLLVTGLVATAGIFSLWRLWVYALAFLLMGFILGKAWRRAGVLTDAELTELRYSGKGAAVLRALKALHLGTFINCTVLAMVLLAAIRIVEPFLVWHQWLPAGFLMPLAEGLQHLNISLSSLPEQHAEVWIRSADNLISVLLITGFTVLYSATGGLRSVVATDVVQFTIMLAATGLYAWVVVGKIGGIGQLAGKLEGLYGAGPAGSMMSFGPSAWDVPAFLFLAVLGVQWFAQFNADGTGYLAQRTMGCRTDADAQKAAVVFTFAQVLLRSLLWLPIALGLLILYPAENLMHTGAAGEAFRAAREGTFAQGIHDLLPPGIRGLMLTGMFAALASTIDTHLNWGASYWTNDLYKRFGAKWAKREPGRGELILVARLSTVGILCLGLLIGSRLSSIQSAWHWSLLLGSGLGVPLILRWLWYRINLWSEIAGGVSSLLFSWAVITFYPDASENVRLLSVTFLSAFAVLAVTLLTPCEPMQTLKAFYARVRPPGFWGPVAQALGEDAHEPVTRLGKGALAVLCCAVSVFLLLSGLGKLIIGQWQQWLPYILVLAGIGLIPFWKNLAWEKTAA